MITFIENSTLRNLRQKLAVLYILNVADILFTLYLLDTGLFEEVNPVMLLITDQSFLAFALKALLIGVLILLLCIRLKGATFHQLKISNYWIVAITIFYIGVNLSHLVWLITYLRV